MEKSIINLDETFKRMEKEIIVPSVTLDGIFGREKYFPTLIKIDAEGAESKILKGGEKLLSSHNPIIVMEYNSSVLEHKEARNFLENKGFSSYFLDCDGGLIREKEDIFNSGFIVFKKI